MCRNFPFSKKFHQTTTVDVRSHQLWQWWDWTQQQRGFQYVYKLESSLCFEACIREWMLTRSARIYIMKKAEGPLGFAITPVPILTNFVPCTHLPSFPSPPESDDSNWLSPASVRSPQPWAASTRAAKKLYNASLQSKSDFSVLFRCLCPTELAVVQQMTSQYTEFSRCAFTLTMVSQYTYNFCSQMPELQCLPLDTMPVLNTKSTQKSKLRQLVLPNTIF